MEIKSYNGQKADFYIQSHGNHAGRPLLKPIPNCFAIYTDRNFAFEIVFALYAAKRFEVLIVGSVIPFVRLYEVKKLLNEEFAKDFHEKLLANVKAADNLRRQTIIKMDKVKRLLFVSAHFAISKTK